MRKNRLGEVAKEAFSSGVETTFPCEQITIGVTSFGDYFINAAHRGAPSRKEISIPPNASLSLKKQTDLGAKRLEGTSWKANTPRPPPAEGRRRLDFYNLKSQLFGTKIMYKNLYMFSKYHMGDFFCIEYLDG